MAFRKRDEIFKAQRKAGGIPLADGRPMTREERIACSPGGVDPDEVCDEMPPELRACFQGQDRKELSVVIHKMEQEGEDTVYFLNRAAAAGLWVPARGTKPSWMREGYKTGPRKSREEILAARAAGTYYGLNASHAATVPPPKDKQEALQRAAGDGRSPRLVETIAKFTVLTEEQTAELCASLDDEDARFVRQTRDNEARRYKDMLLAQTHSWSATPAQQSEQLRENSGKKEEAETDEQELEV